MKTKNIFIGMLVLILSAAFYSCEDQIDPVIEELDFNRVFAPTNLTARVRNQTTIELTWNLKEDADQYVVEFSEDSLQFSSIIRTVTVSPLDLPLQETFEGETRYSARVKGVSNSGVADSKWTAVSIMTDLENIFLPIQDGDIDATAATLRWPAGSEVTHFIINPGNVERPITTDEKAAGIATITGLTGSTDYTVILRRDAKQRGSVSFTTLVDVGGATRVYPEDDLLAIIAAANDGDVLALFPGEYGSSTLGLVIAVEKSITIRGVYPFDKPVMYGQITCGAEVTAFEVRDIVFKGEGYGQFFNTLAGCNLGTLSIIDCEISDYSNNFIYNNTAGTYGDIIIKGSYIHSIPGGGGDGIDFRGGVIGSLTVENNTFANGFRTFLRMQVSCASVFKNNTFYKVANNDNGNNHGLFRSSGGGTFEVRNCLFVQTGVEGITDPANSRGNFCRQASNMVPSPEYSNNNIYDCYNIFGGLYNSAAAVSATEINPGLVDPENGDFTVTNQDIIDNQIGDPRWLQ